jgi:cell division protein FtsW (lipid II flippase)
MGGTSFLLTCISIGLILSVSKHIESEQELQVEKVENI